MVTNIVLLTKNRHSLMNQTMRTLYRNTPIDQFNLTLVDDGSSIPPVHDKPNCLYIRIEKSRGITGQLRNLGIYYADKHWGRGDFLYLTDNDMYFTPDWLDVLTDMMSHCDIDLLGGWNHPFLQPQAEYDQKLFGHIGCAIGKHTAMSHDAVAGASQLMRWETWDKYGPLDAHAVGVGQSEDWKFCQDIIKDGGKVGSIYPRVVFNCGVWNSNDQPSPGSDVMEKELEEAKKTYLDLYWG